MRTQITAKILSHSSVLKKTCLSRKKREELCISQDRLTCTGSFIYMVHNHCADALLLQPSKDTENIYLGPHGAPPSRAKKAEDTWATAGYREKNNKAREAEQKAFGTGRNSKGGNTGEFHRHNGGSHGKDPYKRSA
jgi:hypothetical protein